ncbi:MAG: hypothetical protein R3256_10050, partial [Thalassovita sp.]|nr:hypothetical protein [Thalassovita sp.]
MRYRNVIHTPLMAALLLGGSAAFADVTPADVWGEWKSQMAGFGYEISAKESLSGPDLTISDLSMRIAVPEENGSVDVTLSGMTFQDNGDGTVSVKLPSILPIGIHVATDDVGPLDVTVNYTTTGLAMVASGAPGDLTYTYSAASMGMALAEMVAKGTVVDPGEISLSLRNISGSASTSGTDLRTSKQDFRAEN